MHPGDLNALGIASGAEIEIRSDRGAVIAIAEPSDDVRSGTVSMAHCWGDIEGEDDDPRAFGTSVARLIYNDRDYDPLTGLPRMSNIAVTVTPLVAH